MAEKKRDNKDRILLSNERQCSDGKYEYRYIDRNGMKHSIYSWKLVLAYKISNGKKCEESLRDMKCRIERDLKDDIAPQEAKQITLDKIYDEYMKSKYELKQSTRINYKYIKPVLGNKKSVI